MGFLKSVGKVVGTVAKVAVPVYGMISAHKDMRKQTKAGMQQYEQQNNAIRQQAENAQAERDKVAGQKAKSEIKLKAGSLRANRRRVRGGLFGEGQVDQNINPRLG